MADGYGSFGYLDGLQGSAVSHVGEVDEDAQLVHLTDGVDAEIAQTLVAALEAAVAQQVTLVVGELDHAHAEGVEEAEAVQVVLDG